MSHIWKIVCTLDGTERISGIYKTRREAITLLDDFKSTYPIAKDVTVIKWECRKSERRRPARVITHDPRMTLKANGATYEAFKAAGWTDELMVAAGYMKEVARG